MAQRIRKLKFSENYNNKLLCQFFTTLRLGKSLAVGTEYMIDCPDIEPFKVVVTDMRTGRFGDLNEVFTYLDAAMSRDELMQLMRKFYPHYVINENTIVFIHMLKRV